MMSGRVVLATGNGGRRARENSHSGGGILASGGVAMVTPPLGEDESAEVFRGHRGLITADTS